MRHRSPQHWPHNEEHSVQRATSSPTQNWSELGQQETQGEPWKNADSINGKRLKNANVTTSEWHCHLKSENSSGIKMRMQQKDTERGGWNWSFRAKTICVLCVVRRSKWPEFIGFFHRWTVPSVETNGQDIPKGGITPFGSSNASSFEVPTAFVSVNICGIYDCFQGIGD